MYTPCEVGYSNIHFKLENDEARLWLAKAILEGGNSASSSEHTTWAVCLV